MQSASHALDRVSTSTKLYQYQLLWRSSDLRLTALSANEPDDTAVWSVSIDQSPKCSLATHEDVYIVSWRDMEGFVCKPTEVMRRGLIQDNRLPYLHSKQEPLEYELSLLWCARVLWYLLTVNIPSFNSTPLHSQSQSIFTMLTNKCT
jgi:hypothetical protein